MKTNNLLLIAVAAFLGYQLAPEEVKQQLTGGGGAGTSVSITESPLDWDKLTGLITAPVSEMPFPDMPEWFTQPPDWLNTIKDITLPKLPDVIPDILPDVFPDSPDFAALFDDFLSKIKGVITEVKLPDILPDILPTIKAPQTSGGGGGWWSHLSGGWQDVFDFDNPFDVAKHFYGTDAWSADKLLTDYAKNVAPRPEASFNKQVPVITEASAVFSGGQAPQYTPILSPFIKEHPAIKGVSLVGVLSGSETPIGSIGLNPPPTKAKRWMFT